MLLEADRHAELARPDVPELFAAVSDERIGGRGLASRRIGDMEELDAGHVLRRQSLPAHPGLEVDAAPLAGPLDEALPVRATPRVVLRLGRFGPPVLRMEDLV